jgi:LTXXQ motif family protein
MFDHAFRGQSLGGTQSGVHNVENNGCWSDGTPRWHILTDLRAGPFYWGNEYGAVQRPELGYVADARINIVKAVLQLTPDQEKYWPAVEDAIRMGAKDREARLGAAAERLRELRAGCLAALSDRDPIGFLHRRAGALGQRAAELNKLADAWQPLYQTLNPDQKARLRLLAMHVVREIKEAVRDRRMEMMELEEDEAD